MRIRKAKKSDFSGIIDLAQKFGLDYSGMEADDFWLAGEGKKILGIVGLKKHTDCLELCSLGVDEKYRNRGLAKELVRRLLEEARGEVYLATVIPRFFEKLGFEPAALIPSSMMKKAEWCAGCNQELCTVMKKTRE